MSNLFKKITSKLIYTTLTAIVLVSGSFSAFAYEGIGKVTGNGVNIRSGAGTINSVITTVPKGTQLNIVSRGESWTKVALSDGREGYIINDYLSVKEELEGVVTGSAVNIRKAPSLNGEIIGLVYSGEKLPIIGKENDWVNVKYKDTTGWISAQYISECIDAFANGDIDMTLAQKIVNEAVSHVGKAYVYGGSGPNAFDCSGFTSYVYKQFGYTLNRTAAGQRSNGVEVSRENLQPGDIVLFSNRGYGGIGHAGIYIGNDQFVHANNAQTGVIITTLSNSEYYSSRFVCGRRII